MMSIPESDDMEGQMADMNFDGHLEGAIQIASLELFER